MKTQTLLSLVTLVLVGLAAGLAVWAAGSDGMPVPVAMDRPAGHGSEQVDDAGRERGATDAAGGAIVVGAERVSTLSELIQDPGRAGEHVTIGGLELIGAPTARHPGVWWTRERGVGGGPELMVRLPVEAAVGSPIPGRYELEPGMQVTVTGEIADSETLVGSLASRAGPAFLQADTIEVEAHPERDLPPSVHARQAPSQHRGALPN